MLEVNKVIVGQKYMIQRLLIGLLGKGHILLEGVPVQSIKGIGSKTVEFTFKKHKLEKFNHPLDCSVLNIEWSKFIVIVFPLTVYP